MMTHRVPEGGSPVGVNHAAKLGDHDRVEILQMIGHEQKPRQRQQPAVATTAVGGRKKQAAHFAGAIMLLQQMQRADGLADVQLRRRMYGAFQPIAVERIEPADLGDDPAGAGDLPGGGIFQHEQVGFTARGIFIA